MNGRRIATDLVLAGSYHLLEKLVGWIILLMLARHLAVPQLGEFFFATTLAWFAALFSELGTHNYLIRRVAGEPRKAARALSEVLAVRLPLMALVFVALNAGVAVAQRPLVTTTLLASTYILLLELYYSFGAVMLGLRRVGVRVVTGVSGQLLLAALIVAAVRAGAGLMVVLLCYVAANAVLLLGTFAISRRLVGVVRPAWNRSRVRAVVAASLPLFAVGALGWMHSKADTVMLGMLGTYEDVARYEVAYKFLEVSRFAIRPVTMVFFPVSAALAAAGDWLSLRSMSMRVLLIVTALGVGATAVVLPTAPWLVVALFGDAYEGSASLLRVLMLGAPAVFAGMAGVFLANAMHLEKAAAGAALGCLILNVTANAMAIPRWGALGASWTTVGTESILGAALAWLVVRHLGGGQRGRWKHETGGHA